MQPVDHMWSLRAFLAARESFLNCRKCCKSPTLDNCHFRISFKL